MIINKYFLLFSLIIVLCNNCVSCITDVDTFTWKNSNLKGIRVVEYDTMQNKFLRISYHLNLEEDEWYTLRTSSQDGKRSILSAKSNGDVLLDDTEFKGTLVASSHIHTSTLIPEMTYPSRVFSDESMESENNSSKNRYFVTKKDTLSTNYSSALIYDRIQIIAETSLDQIIPDTFCDRCIQRRYGYMTRSITEEGLKLLNCDRNDEKGILGELASTLLCIANNYVCKLSIKNDDEHHGTYDGAYIPFNTDQPSMLILTESKYKTGDPHKLVSRFSSDYYSTFLKLWNSKGENAAFKRKTANIMRFRALQSTQNIKALINIGNPIVQLSWFDIFVDPTPFYYVLYHQPYNIAINTQPEIPTVSQSGISFDNMLKIVKLTYFGRNSKKGESLVSINQWFGFNEKHNSGSFKYVLRKDMKALSLTQMHTIFWHFNAAIYKLLESNSLTEKTKNIIKQIAGITPITSIV